MQINSIKIRGNKRKKRVGRGGANGTYSCRGMKGQKARSGYSRRATWEGGRTTIVAVTKKRRGFKSRNIKPEVISVAVLEKHFQDGDLVNLDSLYKKKIVKPSVAMVKVLGDGDLTKKIKVEGILVSEIAKKKIKSAGGEVL